MEIENYFIQENEYKGVELVCSRAAVARFYLTGSGLEIGALHKPLQISLDRCSIKYVDYKSLAENRQRYPELANDTIVNTDIIDDGFILKKVADASQDFIIANHALEHSPDPFGTLLKWLVKLRTNGIIYVTVPISEKCYDKGRPTTTLEHLIADHGHFKSMNKEQILKITEAHIREFLMISDRNIREMNGMQDAAWQEKEQLLNDLIAGLKPVIASAGNYDELMNAHINKINRIYDIHYHTFTPKSYEAFLQYFCGQTNAGLENVVKNGNGECIGIIRKM